MPKLVSVFDYCTELPQVILDHLDNCQDYVLSGNIEVFNFPLDWTADSFDEGIESTIIDSYFEVVTFLKARLLHGTTEAYIE